MKKLTVLNVAAVFAIILVLSACGAKNNQADGTATSPSPSPSATATAQNEQTAPSTSEPTASPAHNEATASPDQAAGHDDQQAADGEILILIDQSPKPIEGNSFDFTVKKRPEGYALSEMKWKSDKHEIVNTIQQAAANGGSGEDGFYISGDGQFMGFDYPNDLKGEKGEVSFTFSNDQGQKLTWKKAITLK